MRTLTPRHRQFVSFLLGESEGNATDAARRAGYPHPNTSGPRLLVSVSIRAAIDAKLAETALGPDEIGARLSGMATADMGDFWLVEGTTLRFDFARAKKLGLTYLIKELKHTRYGISVKLHDSQVALQTLARIRGMLKDRDDSAPDPDAEQKPRLVIPKIDERLEARED